MKISVVICSRNPRADYFTRVLEAIEAQSLPKAQWELVVVDSASQPPLTVRNLPCPSNTRFVREPNPGVFTARRAGVRAAVGDWILFVDDDNVLDHDYLQRGLEIPQTHPTLTLFCGRISGEFETAPPKWLKAFYQQLAIVDFQDDSWAAERDFNKIPVWTAGMFLNRAFALDYYRATESDLFRLGLNRCEDVDLVTFAVDQKLLVGKFLRLHMRHLIPKERMTVEYISRICSETGYNLGRMHRRETSRPISHLSRAAFKTVRARLSLECGIVNRVEKVTTWSYLRGLLAG